MELLVSFFRLKKQDLKQFLHLFVLKRQDFVRIFFCQMIKQLVGARKSNGLNCRFISPDIFVAIARELVLRLIYNYTGLI